MNGYRVRAKSHRDVSVIRREQCAEALKRAEIDRADAKTGRASVPHAPTTWEGFRRLSDAFDAKERECKALREAVHWSCRSADNMTRAYELVVLELGELR